MNVTNEIILSSWTKSSILVIFSWKLVMNPVFWNIILQYSKSNQKVCNLSIQEVFFSCQHLVYQTRSKMKFYKLHSVNSYIIVSIKWNRYKVTCFSFQMYRYMYIQSPVLWGNFKIYAQDVKVMVEMQHQDIRIK